MHIKSKGFGGRIFSVYSKRTNLAIASIGALVGAFYSVTHITRQSSLGHDLLKTLIMAFAVAFLFVFIANIIHVQRGP